MNNYKLASEARKKGDLDTAEKLCLEDLKNNPKDQFMKNMYSWVLYDKHIKNIDDLSNKDLILEKSNIIINLSKDKFSAYNKTVLKMAKFFKDSKLWDFALEWINKLDINTLSKDPFVKDDGKKYMSEIEIYYLTKCKSLFSLKMYPECYTLCKEAFETVSEFTTQNDLWIGQYMALSLAENKSPLDAIKILNQLIEHRKKWFFYMHLAELYEKLNDSDFSIKNYVEAILCPDGEIEKKVNVFEKLINHIENNEFLSLLYNIVIKIRQKENWPIKDDFLENMNRQKLKEYSNLGIYDIFSMMIPYFGEIKFGKKPFSGEIIKILEPGCSGFIKGEHKSYYFSAYDFFGNKSKLIPGLKVNFFIELRLNKKKMIEEENAVCISA